VADEVRGYGTDGLSIGGEVPVSAIGTLDELQAEGLDPAVYHSCHRFDKFKGVKGCDEAHRCPFSFKFKSRAEGGGPVRLAWEYAKGPNAGNQIIRREGSCYDFAALQEDAQINGGAMNVIAMEPGYGFPSEYEKVEGIAIKFSVDALGNESEAPAKKAELMLPSVQRVDRRVKHTIKPHPRPKDNPALATDLLAAEIYEREQTRRREEAFGKVIGVQGAVAPVDQRHKRDGESQGSKAKGGA